MLKDLGENKSLIESAIKNTVKLNKKKNGIQLKKTIMEINRLIKITKSEDMTGKEIKKEYKKLVKEREEIRIQQEKIQMDIERCEQDNINTETIKEALLSI
ncbi:MAG: hypothetical protein MRJ65_01715 [Candidatus Brocadiaceae bacterium]|nr:hypothetical protein [Candidatus Brocadiaceae bacterium]